MVFLRDVDDCLRADRTLKMAVDLGLGNVVVFGVEVFQGKASYARHVENAATAPRDA